MLEECEPVCLMANLEEEAWLWHARLGLVNFGALKSMAVKGMVHGLPRINHPTQLCEGCLVGKQTRSPFPTQSIRRSDVTSIGACRSLRSNFTINKRWEYVFFITS